MRHGAGQGTHESGLARSGCAVKPLEFIASLELLYVAVQEHGQGQNFGASMMRYRGPNLLQSLGRNGGRMPRRARVQTFASAGITSRTNRSTVRSTSASVRSPKANWPTK